MRAPGSTVAGLIEEGQTLIEVEVQTNWTPEEIKALALEEGYGINAVNGRFQPIPKGKPVTGIVRHSLEQEAAASIALDRDETHVLDEPVEGAEVTEDETGPHGRPDDPEVADSDDEAEASGPASANAAAASSSLPETDTGTASAPDGAPAEPQALPEDAALGAAVPVSLDPTTTFVPNAEALLSAARATGDLVFFDEVTEIETALTDLARHLIAWEELAEDRAAARAEVARLEEEAVRVAADLERARARAGLGTATPSPVTPVEVPGTSGLSPATTGSPTRVSHAGMGGVAGVRLPDGVTYKDIRAWTDKVGILTPPRGRLSDDIVLRYLEAHPQAGAA